MKEDFLHYVWRNKAMAMCQMLTTDNKPVEIIHFGDYLQTDGPDFFNARIRIDGQLWAGNVEMHIKSSSWYGHNHEKDAAYDNVILHVVWEDDVPIFRKDETLLPTLVLSEYVNKKAFENYRNLFQTKKYLNCESFISDIKPIVWLSWKERLLVERLAYKSEPMKEKLLATNHHWEEVFYQFVVRNFGLKANGKYFAELAERIPFSVIQKERHEVQHLEALFFGMANLLDNSSDEYTEKLRKTYEYLKVKHQLEDNLSGKPQFFRLRPPNFPTIRLAQLAQLLHQNEHLFHELVVEPIRAERWVKNLQISPSDYWKTHFVLGKESQKSTKKLTPNFIDLLLINTVFPFRFVHRSYTGETDFEDIIEAYRHLMPEKNHIVELFEKLAVPVESALDSQTLIHLKQNYCDPKRCLHCAIGNQILNHER
ncbi:DUF2851 family protein [Avrilella dinanensis]|uniref:DUF2851 domain-containing protein n=1 Tax=Avrilella dinanensis TaxID=2008672 RepID=A0A2M9R7A2_9FLAO|nr:DUF2851 family protein [Avrilella dinanensis]PJR04741.1 hypothetical protein CDL10_09435 [Avrilella dinanensis]